MVSPAFTVDDPVVFVTETSMSDTVTAVVEELFSGFGSVVAADTVAVFGITVPVDANGVWAVSVYVTEAPAPSAAMLHVTVPPELTGGVVQPAGGEIETKVSPPDSVSLHWP